MYTSVVPVIEPDLLLSYGATPDPVDEGEVIFNEGATPEYYYQLVSGSINWISKTEGGRHFLQEIILPGDTFGELGLFDQLPYAATSIANEKCIVMKLPVSKFHQLIKEHPEVHFRISKMMAGRIRFKFLMLKESTLSDPPGRLQALLDYLKKQGRHICITSSKVSLTRQQLADITGLRVETVIRTIKQLQLKGILKITKGKIYYK